MIKAANDAGGKDNITVVLVKNDKSRLMQEATKPVPAKKNEDPQEEEQVIEKEEPAQQIVEPVVTNTKRKGASAFIYFLLIILIAALGWFIYKDYLHQPPKPKAVMPPPQKRINADEQKLIDSINNKKEISLNKIFTSNQPIIFTDSVLVDKDSIHIHGNQYKYYCRFNLLKMLLLYFLKTCKYILIDSLTLENFNVGIITQNKALHLKDVQFKNCKVAVQHEIFSDEKIVSGKIIDSLSSEKKIQLKQNNSMASAKANSANRNTERIFLLLITIVMSVLFYKLYTVLSKNFTEVPARLAARHNDESE